jgi:thiol-disulfide isomerase/thioredoxin
MGIATLVGFVVATSAMAGPPPLEQALALSPIQKDVDYVRPSGEEAKKCTIQAETIGNAKGWVVRDGIGQVLRRFIDTNGDNVVDQWCYYRDGLEVYRDVDANHNGKADQYRWLNTAGSRWGLDSNEDGKIDQWKMISAEEVSSEFVRALVDRDEERFSRLLLTKAELDGLGLGAEKAEEIAKKLEAASAAFRAAASQQKLIGPKADWVQFAATRPGLVPQGSEGSTKELLVYENVVALVDDAGKHEQVPVGTLVQVGPVWRLIAMPKLAETETASVDSSEFFRPYLKPNFEGGAPGGAPDAKTQDLLSRLEKLDQETSKAGADDLPRLNGQRADLLEQLAAAATSDDERNAWRRQLADTVSAAVQSGGFPDGVARLNALYDKVKDEPANADLAAYIKFRGLSAAYGQSLQQPDADFAKIQEKWLADLDQYIKDYPKSQDTAEALLQLAIAKEFAGEEDEAKEFYGRIVSEFGKEPAAAKAAGARTRLECVGKPITLRGPALNGKPVDLSQLRGKTVLVQYWATWCEPCKADMAQLKDLLSKYGKSGFVVLGVNLDSKKQDLADFLKQNPLPWVQIYEPGGLDSRLANEMGILTLPTMILIDDKGNVVNRNLHVTQLENELKQRLK